LAGNIAEYVRSIFIMRVSLSVLRYATQDYFRKIKKTIAKTSDDSRVYLLNINIPYL
jgi:hypothetical protein